MAQPAVEDFADKLLILLAGIASATSASVRVRMGRMLVLGIGHGRRAIEGGPPKRRRPPQEVIFVGLQGFHAGDNFLIGQRIERNPLLSGEISSELPAALGSFEGFPQFPRWHQARSLAPAGDWGNCGPG